MRIQRQLCTQKVGALELHRRAGWGRIFLIFAHNWCKRKITLVFDLAYVFSKILNSSVMGEDQYSKNRYREWAWLTNYVCLTDGTCAMCILKN